MLLVVFVLTTILAACSKSTDNASNTNASAGNTGMASESANPSTASETAEDASNKEPVTLKLVTWSDSYGDLYEKFHQKYPWITIEPVIGAGADKDIIERITALQAAGTPADLTWLSDLGAYTEGGLLEDLKPYMDKDESLKNKKLPDGFFEAFETDGKRYAVPFVDVPMWVVVNKDLLEKYGMEMPGNDWTYDDMREMAKKATDPAAGEFGFTNNDLFALHFLTAVAVANGSAPNLNYMNEDLTQSVLNTPAVLEDVKWMQELMTKDGSLPGHAKAKELGDSINNFINGKTLFDVGGDWVLEPLSKQAKFNWDVLPFPVGKAKQATYHIYGPIAVLSGSKHKEEAYKWISFQFEMEAQKWKIDHGSNASVIDDAITAYVDESPLWQGKNKEAVKLTKDMCCIAPGPTIPAYAEYPWSSTLGPVMDGTDVNSIIPAIDAWNKKTLELRKKLGK